MNFLELKNHPVWHDCELSLIYHENLEFINENWYLDTSIKYKNYDRL